MDGRRRIPPGKLILVVGASGAGKDTLLGVARMRLGHDGFAFPRRWITTSEDRGENHVPVSEAEFSAALAAGRIALHWRAHGLRYGIPADIRTDLGAGAHVLANASRSIIDEARACFAPLLIVNVTVPPQVLRQRLRERARESAAEIEARVRRAAAFVPTGPEVATFSNDLPLPQAGDAFVALLLSLTRN